MSKAIWGLEKLNLFKNLNPMEIREVIKIVRKENFHKGDIVTDQDNRSRNIYILFDGVVDIVSLKGIPLYRVSKGETFGELAMITSIKRTAVAVAREESWVVILNMNHLDRLRGEFPEISAKISDTLVHSMAVKLARANKLIEILKSELTQALKK